MAVIHTVPRTPPRAVRADRDVPVALGVTALTVTSYVVTLVVPYYAAGAPDLSSSAVPATGQPWSYPAALGPLMAVLLFWAVCVAPFACAGVAGWAVRHLWATRAVPGVRVAAWAALVVSVVTFGWFCVQGAGLVEWTLD